MNTEISDVYKLTTISRCVQMILTITTYGNIADVYGGIQRYRCCQGEHY